MRRCVRSRASAASAQQSGSMVFENKAGTEAGFRNKTLIDVLPDALP
jgi:hypothetical protein